ncbi:hypothetical protein [Nocardioides luteus]|uniref:Integral membrane protein n=1 Tax=Nocardioides luteus TaxID=1844 RepID=A0A1J4N9V1_9ACTN|nr:hypothetical protein [Nocardioides luteus]OIJ27257.1 hypothetical protein UG56_007685 [Nocardioides luteus]
MDAVTLIAFIVAGYAAFVTIAAALGVALRAPRPRWLDQLGWMLEILAVVLAIGALAAWSAGRKPESLSTFLGYLGALVCLMPLALQTMREDRSTWSSGVIAAAALATGVVAVRVMMVR